MSLSLSLGAADFVLHVEGGALVSSAATVRATATDIEEVRAALALQLGLTDVKVCDRASRPTRAVPGRAPVHSASERSFAHAHTTTCRSGKAP